MTSSCILQWNGYLNVSKAWTNPNSHCEVLIAEKDQSARVASEVMENAHLPAREILVLHIADAGTRPNWPKRIGATPLAGGSSWVVRLRGP